MPKMIFLAGKAGAGKDTAAKVFTDRGWMNLKLAGPLKAMLGTLLALRGADEKTILRMLEGDLKALPSLYLDDQTPRHAMQTLGTEWGREKIGRDFWLHTFKDMADTVTADPTTAPAGIIVTDVRFRNEAEFLVAMCGAEGYFVRRGKCAADSGFHPSEDLAWATILPHLDNTYETPEEFQTYVACRFFAAADNLKAAMIRQGIG